MESVADQGSNKLSEQLFEAIEERIATGDMPPGARVNEEELAEAFGVSRTPIREVLIQLAAMRMIEKRPRKGWVVTEMSPVRLGEMFEVMAVLEGMCGRLAASRSNGFDQHRIRVAHEACRGVSDPDRYYRLNEQFHLAIYEASQNEFLIEQARALQRRARPYRRLQLRVPSRVATSFREHQGIVDAVLASDSALAETRMHSHVMVQGERFASLVESLENLKGRRQTAPSTVNAVDP